MDPQAAIDLGRQAIMTTLVLCAPVLVAGLVVGLLVGLLQAATQIQEQTLSFVPKLIAMLVVTSIGMPWLVTRLVTYFQDLVHNIPSSL
ncbi:MAG TPA: flagellar biosynthesis protein FliQ [Pirellulales bacterium]|jgi:flagellar biosynthetic protein FliQ